MEIKMADTHTNFAQAARSLAIANREAKLENNRIRLGFKELKEKEKRSENISRAIRAGQSTS